MIKTKGYNLEWKAKLITEFILRSQITSLSTIKIILCEDKTYHCVIQAVSGGENREYDHEPVLPLFVHWKL